MGTVFVQIGVPIIIQGRPMRHFRFTLLQIEKPGRAPSPLGPCIDYAAQQFSFDPFHRLLPVSSSGLLVCHIGLPQKDYVPQR